MQKRGRYIKDEGLKDRRRSLRSELTRSEYILWQELRREKLGFKFRRQTSIGKFIVDFYCYELRLIIEVDGWVHDDRKEYDQSREQWLTSRGYIVLRFSNDSVLFEREKVLQKIKGVCAELKNTS